MLAEIQLSAEQKFNVLLAAFVLFLLAVLVALCLAVSLCPLNRWLHERDGRRRKRRQEQAVRQFRNQIQSHQLTSQQSYYTNYHSHNLSYNQHQLNNNKCAPQLASCLGPPPAYEAALRATRLQSLTSNSLIPSNVDGASGKELAHDSPDWLKTALSNHQMGSGETSERQLDLGDYFHPPKELFFAPASSHYHGSQHRYSPHLAIQMDVPPTMGSSATNRPQAPVMLRLWVKLLEPDELIKWARKQKEANNNNNNSDQLAGQPAERTRFPSLTRQLSIPQLFGSLMTLAGGSTGSKTDERANHPQDCDEATTKLEADQQPSSLSSSVSSASSTSSSSSSVSLPEGEFESTASHSGPSLQSPDQRPKRYASQMAPVRSITSRVLHMNVASFSYVKDENLISTKKHNQLNFQHFHSSSLSSAAASRTEPVDGNNRKDGQHKMCQLLVSICDIENLLGSSWLENRACMKLAQNSSVYIKCEILAAKSSGAARLLRNPLRVLTNQDSAQSGETHTIDFGPTLPAASIEPRHSALARATSPSRGLSRGAGESTTAMVAPTGGNDSEQRSLNSLSASSTSDDAQPSEAATNQTFSPDKHRRETRIKWRHEPAADGKAIVVFSSIPKQVAQQQQFAASALSSRTATNSSVSMTSAAGHSLEQSTEPMDHIDLIQFDSVFVSPILSKSLLENGHIRLRVYAQCKHVNETCLAELKLPLKQLMRSQSRDNLADASAGGQRAPPQHQADFILNNLLANLVTASSGAPLATLIEQISAEERETADLEAMRSSSENLQPGGAAVLSLHRSSSSPPAGPLASWLGGAGGGGHEPQPEQEQDQLIEENHCRSLMVSHWLNYLVAPSYECQLVEEARGKLVLGLTYLPTSNRLVFNAHRASIELVAGGNGQHSSSEGHKQLVKRLRMQSDTSYLLRFIMVANGRVLKRRQTACARKPEWDSQEPVTFDLVNVAVERPSFIVALVMRNPYALAAAAAGSSGGGSGSSGLGGSLQSLSSYHQVRPCGDTEAERNPGVRERACACQSDPESLRAASSGGAARYQFEGPEASHLVAPGLGSKQARDLVVGHLVLADELWLELKAQPRRQLVKQFKLL